MCLQWSSTVADIAVSLGYKLDDNDTVGFATSYKLGLGENFSNIRFSQQGYTLRSFLYRKVTYILSTKKATNKWLRYKLFSGNYFLL